MPRPKQTVVRYRRRIEVRYEAPGHTPQIGFSGNLSTSGMMLRTPRAHPPGTVLKLHLCFPDTTLKLTGRVVWAREGSIQWLPTGRIGMGLKFIDPPADLAALIKGASAIPGTASRAKG